MIESDEGTGEAYHSGGPVQPRPGRAGAPSSIVGIHVARVSMMLMWVFFHIVNV
jgi:hypothetical protein